MARQSKSSITDRIGRKHGQLVLGTTSEGIDILKPHGNPTSFTWAQLRDAIAHVRSRPTA